MAVQTLTIGYLVVIITWNGCGCNATVCMWRDHWWVMLFESIWIWNRILVGAICWIALAVVGASFLNWNGCCWLKLLDGWYWAFSCALYLFSYFSRNQPRHGRPNSPIEAHYIRCYITIYWTIYLCLPPIFYECCHAIILIFLLSILTLKFYLRNPATTRGVSSSYSNFWFPCHWAAVWAHLSYSFALSKKGLIKCLFSSCNQCFL